MIDILNFISANSTLILLILLQIASYAMIYFAYCSARELRSIRLELESIAEELKQSYRQ